MMSEEIKFRAYSKERNKMHDVACINYVSKQVGSFMYKTSKRTGYTNDWMKDVDLMRYIGLKDNYGTEIYEDDIVEHFDGEYFFTGVVTYSPFGWYAKSKYDNIPFEHFADESSETADCKVIGNIYETEKEEGSDGSEVYADGWPGLDREKIEADRRELRQAFEMIKKGLHIFHEIEYGEGSEIDAD